MPGNALLPGHGACSRQQRKVQGIQGQEDSICMRRWRQVQEEAHGYQALCLRTSMQASNVALLRTSIRQLLNNAILRAALTRAESLILSHVRNFTRTASNLRMPSSWLKKSKSTKRLDQSYFIASSSRDFHWPSESAQ